MEDKMAAGAFGRARNYGTRKGKGKEWKKQRGKYGKIKSRRDNIRLVSEMIYVGLL